MKLYAFSLVFLFFSIQVKAQGLYNNFILSYKYAAPTYEGVLGDDISSLSSPDFLSFHGFSFGTVFIENGRYFSITTDFSRAFSDNKASNPTQLDLRRNKLSSFSSSFDFGINLTRKKVLISSGLGLGLTGYKEKKWAYTVSNATQSGDFKTLNYSFDRVAKEKSGSFDLRFFINFLFDNPRSPKRNLNLKPFVNIPITKENFRNGIAPKLAFLGLDFGIVFF